MSAEPVSPSGAGRRVWLWGPVVVSMAVIFLLSSLSAPPDPGQLNDKTKHFAGYGVLGAVTLRATAGGAVSGLTGGAAAAAWTIAALYGVSDEVHQSFVPGRTPDVFDVAADATGAAVSIGALWAFGIIMRSRRPSGASSAPPRRR